jgi:hypothetical protein
VKDEAKAVILLLHHLDGTQVLEEATLKLVLDRLVVWVTVQASTVVFFDPKRALETLSLVTTA